MGQPCTALGWTLHCNMLHYALCTLLQLILYYAVHYCVLYWTLQNTSLHFTQHYAKICTALCWTLRCTMMSFTLLHYILHFTMLHSTLFYAAHCTALCWTLHCTALHFTLYLTLCYVALETVLRCYDLFTISASEAVWANGPVYGSKSLVFELCGSSLIDIIKGLHSVYICLGCKNLTN